LISFKKEGFEKSNNVPESNLNSENPNSIRKEAEKAEPQLHNKSGLKKGNPNPITKEAENGEPQLQNKRGKKLF